MSIEPHWWDRVEAIRKDEREARHALEARCVGRHKENEGRVDELEAWRDELRGAMVTVRFLIGSNLLLAATTIVAIIVAWK